MCLSLNLALILSSASPATDLTARHCINGTCPLTARGTALRRDYIQSQWNAADTTYCVVCGACPRGGRRDLKKTDAERARPADRGQMKFLISGGGVRSASQSALRCRHASYYVYRYEMEGVAIKYIQNRSFPFVLFAVVCCVLFLVC